MTNSRWVAVAAFALSFSGSPCAAQAVVVSPQSLTRLGTVDDRFQSYNIEMVEVTGGRFWKPYKASTAQESSNRIGGTPAGMDPNLYEYRAPIDLYNSKLRNLAAALAPAYVRVSGTWANATYFPEKGEVASSPPPGFNSVLTRPMWKGVIEFARATDAQIVTSFATSVGTRDTSGTWTPVQAKRVLGYTKSLGSKIAAAEFMNEPSFAAIGGAPKGYDAAAYGSDFRVFHDFIKQAAPNLIILGPGSVGESTDRDSEIAMPGMLRTRELLVASGPGVDGFSYHHYGAVSARCAKMAGNFTISPDAALSEAWLSKTDQTLAYYQKLRDEFEPRKPMWLTETAEAACGGDSWAATFLDSFRYLDQLGRLAKAGVRVVMHNTLAASDYGLLDEKTLMPRPNYWAALLWRRLMGTTVLDSGVPIAAGLHLYAACLRGVPGGVALMAINTDRSTSRELELPVASVRYTLSAPELQDSNVLLNGKPLSLTANEYLPRIAGTSAPAGRIALSPATITFLTVANASNAECR